MRRVNATLEDVFLELTTSEKNPPPWTNSQIETAQVITEINSNVEVSEAITEINPNIETAQAITEINPNIEQGELP
jgi:hypothetical protein